MTVGDLIQIIDTQTYLGQTLLNVYYYRLVSTAPFIGVGLEVMTEDFFDVVVNPIRYIQNQGLIHRSLYAVNLTTGVDFYDDTMTVAGLATATASLFAPSYVSAGFKLLRSSLATRNGYKRIAGLDEGMISGNSFVADPEFVTDIEVALAQKLQDGIIEYAEPIIVKRPIASPAVVPYDYSDVVSAQFARLGTQNTRKAS